MISRSSQVEALSEAATNEIIAVAAEANGVAEEEVAEVLAQSTDAAQALSKEEVAHSMEAEKDSCVQFACRYCQNYRRDQWELCLRMLKSTLAVLKKVQAYFKAQPEHEKRIEWFLKKSSDRTDPLGG